jgi:enterobacterial common antigen flippase
MSDLTNSAVVTADPQRGSAASETEGSSYGRILKTSTLLGGSSLISVGLGVFRTKILAVQLGPAFFGVMGLYASLTGMIGSVASLGLGQSAVRDIAAAAATQDELRMARTVRAYRRVVWITGITGLLMTLALALPASWWTFGDFNHVWAIAALSVTVLCAQIQAGQNTLLQGLRRIKDMSAVSITGSVCSTLLAIPILLVFREKGIVPFLIAVALGQVVTSWWYARRVRVQHVTITWRETWELSRGMLSFGLTILLSGVAYFGSVYTIRLIINHYSGEAAVGLYQSAFMISSVYVGFVLGAMAGDYYPRLTGLDADVQRRNQLVNEQVEMAVLLVVPGLVAVLALSNVVIWSLYSTRFAGASGILRWQVLGLMGRIISCPLGFLLLARADKVAYFWSEFASALVHVTLVFFGTMVFGVQGAGAAFACLYLYYVVLIYWVAKKRHGYFWQRRTRNIVLLGTLAVVMAFGATFVNHVSWRLALGLIVLLIVSVVCLRGLVERIGREKIGASLLKVRMRLGLIRA